MKRIQSRYVLASPARRPLKIFASDPMQGRAAGNLTTIAVGNEKLTPGPAGSRIEVVDYDGSVSGGRYYQPVDLDDPAILMQGGLEPTESDPRFHQQMVYAVGMKVLENFERALGRSIYFLGGRRLRLLPHAFRGANAFYDRRLLGVLFGYFRADQANPGRNLPGQNVFTCLSHDIIAHEVTHALVDRLRSNFLEFSNPDVAAFHEGFADIVAIFQHFTFPDILHDYIRATRTDLRSPTPLVQLAQQFGYATGRGRALRSAVDLDTGGALRARARGDEDQPAAEPLYQSVMEPHERGSILVAAVFDGFFSVYQRRIADLLRIATGGTGMLPAGDLHPDLITRVAGEASRTAQSILTMCIRAFEYLPPVDVTFGDYLRALVTADYELNPSDDVGQRACMIEAFRSRGVYPDGVWSLAEESLLWENAPPEVPRFPVALLGDLSSVAPGAFSQASPPRESRPAERTTPQATPDLSDLTDDVLRPYAESNAELLGLQKGRPIDVQGFHSVFRVGQDGRLVIEIVTQFVQLEKSEKAAMGGLPLRGGSTVIAGADGTVRYVISKPLSRERLEKQREWIDLVDSTDPAMTYLPEDRRGERMVATGFAAIHRSIVR
ncbi:MAG: hypothetical protein ABJC61_06820 [Acidobacteriota bacterium]